MDDQQKIDLIAAILAVGPATEVNSIIARYRRIRHILQTEGLEDPAARAKRKLSQPAMAQTAFNPLKP